MTPKEQLMAARALIEEGWCKNAFARDSDGESLGPITDDLDWSKAACVCAAGALARVGSLYEGEAHLALASVIGTRLLSYWNDTHTHAEVLQAFDKAIAAQPN